MLYELKIRTNVESFFSVKNLKHIFSSAEFTFFVQPFDVHYFRGHRKSLKVCRYCFYIEAENLYRLIFNYVCFRFCHLPKTPHEPHFMNQNIMISHG